MKTKTYSRHEPLPDYMLDPPDIPDDDEEDADPTEESLVGVHYEMGAEEYHALPGISKSGLDLIAKSPYLYRYQPRREPTREMILGAAVHCAALESGDFDKRYAALPEGLDRRSKAGKEKYAAFLQEHEGKIILSLDDWQQVEAMAEAIDRHPVAGGMFAKATPETSVFSLDEKTGELIKARPDLHIEDILVDLKTTTDASPEAFSKVCWNFRYHVQAAFYLDIANTQDMGTEQHPKFTAFLFVAVEKAAPYQVAVYCADEMMIMAGRAEYRRNLDLYHYCRRANKWPMYGDERIQQISLPGWATRYLEKDFA